MFKLFFKPKWQHRNHEVRLQAIRELLLTDADSLAILRQLALQDVDAGVRIEAWRRMPAVDWHLLSQAWQNESDAVLRTLLWQMLLARIESVQAAPNDFDLWGWLEQQQDAALWEHLASRALWVELRRKAITQVQRESCLCDTVVRDPALELRLHALERIEKTATLERLLRETRNKDKTVSKVIKERLAATAEQLNRPIRLNEEAQRIGLQLDAISQSGADMESLQLQWQRILPAWLNLTQELGPDLNPETAQRFKRVAQVFAEREAEYQRQQADRLEQQRLLQQQTALRQPLLQQLQQLLHEIEQQPLEQSAAALEQIQQTWQQLPSMQEGTLSALQRQFELLQQQLQTHLRQLPLVAARQQQLNQLLAQVQSAAKTGLTSKQLARWRRELAEPPVESLLPLWQQIDELLQPLELQAQQQQQQQQQHKQQLRQQQQVLLAKLQQEVDAGHLRESQQCIHQLQKILPAGSDTALESAFNALKLRVQEWRDWQNWVATPRKEALCDVVEQLVRQPRPLLEQAKLVQEARALWQQLGATEPQSAQSLWERFNQACIEAYAPCKLHFEQQAQQRAQAYNARAALCAEMSQRLASMDWPQVNWTELEAQLKLWQQQWRDMGLTEPKQRKQLNEQFYQLIRQFEQQRQQLLQANLQAKQQVLLEAEQILQASDSSNSIEQIKVLQQRWKTLGRSGQDKQLWQRFRSLCDQIFSRRDQERQQQQQDQQQYRAERERLCAAVAELTRANASVDAITEQNQHLQQQWDALPAAEPRAFGKWQQRQQELSEHLQRQRNRIKQAERLAVLTGLEQAAAQFNRLVVLAQQQRLQPSATIPELSGLVARFNAEISPALNEQFQQLVALFAEAQPQALSAWLSQNQAKADAERQLICLKMEILAGVSSPAEWLEARMQQQLHMLSQRLNQGQTEPSLLDAGLALKRDWLQAGPATTDVSLNQRFELAVQAWLQHLV